MPRLWLVALLLTSGGCKKKSANAGADQGVEMGESSFVAIDFSDEEDELDAMFGSELMTATAE